MLTHGKPYSVCVGGENLETNDVSVKARHQRQINRLQGELGESGDVALGTTRSEDALNISILHRNSAYPADPALRPRATACRSEVSPCDRQAAGQVRSRRQAQL